MRLENIRELMRRINGTWTVSILAHLDANGSAKFTAMRATLCHPDTGAPICRQALTNALDGLRDWGVVTRDDQMVYRLTAEGHQFIALLLGLEAAYAAVAAEAAERFAAARAAAPSTSPAFA